MLPAFLPPCFLSASLCQDPLFLHSLPWSADKLPLCPLTCHPLLSYSFCLTCRQSVKPTYHKKIYSFYNTTCHNQCEGDPLSVPCICVHQLSLSNDLTRKMVFSGVNYCAALTVCHCLWPIFKAKDVVCDRVKSTHVRSFTHIQLNQISK